MIVFREDNAREISALRKKNSDKEARLKRDAEQAESAAAVLRDSKLALEGAVVVLEEKKAYLKRDLRAEQEQRSREVAEVKSDWAA